MGYTPSYSVYFYAPFLGPIHFTLKMKATLSSETLVTYHIITRNREHHGLNRHRRENHKSRKHLIFTLISLKRTS